MYNYQQEKQNIFTENGQVMFMKIRDKVNYLLKEKKYFIMEEVLGCEGSAWEIMACVDRLKELREITEISGSGAMGQHRAFMR